MTLPEGLSQETFEAALGEIADVIGSDWVFTREDDVNAYRDAYSPLKDEPGERLASAAVAPQSVEEVQHVARVANKYGLPLYTISTGRNLAYGGSAPVESGCVVLDLKRMNRVLEVNEENAYALVEPGVSYFDLYRHIRERGLKLWLDVPDPGWGSPLGNALDRGAGRTQLPYRDHFDAHCGMEVVLANGDVVRTGMGALPKAETWQQFKYGAGPYVDGIFSQSNYGIVTKMGFWLMPEPEVMRSWRVRCRRHDDAIPLVRILANLMQQGIVNCSFGILSPPFLGDMDDQKAALLDRADGGSAEDWDAYAANLGTHFWETELTFYGPAGVVEAQWAYTKNRLSAIPGVTFEDSLSYDFPLSDDEIEEIADLVPLGIPSLNVFAFMGGTAGHLDCSPIIPMNGETILKAHRLFAQAYRRTGLRQTLGYAITYHWRSFIMFQGMRLTDDEEENAKVRKMYGQLLEMAANEGWGIYRTHTIFMDDVMRTYSFNDHALTRLHETLKDALDPKGILSPGRYGIWPKDKRGQRK